MSKRIEVLKETIPGLTRVGYLANSSYAVLRARLTACGGIILGREIHR